MKYYLGIDGGGTKTAYLLADETRKEIASITQGGCSYREIGISKVVKQFSEGIATITRMAGIEHGEVSCTAIGLPCYGESTKNDAILEEEIGKLFSGRKYVLANDVKVGWAGSLELRPGINIVAGTGSIAYGENADGRSARSGGWSSFFSDEGSCDWLGRRAMELFFKEADGRTERGTLYPQMLARFGLKNPVELVDVPDQDYVPFRDKAASLQRVLLAAADTGDKAAIRLYETAAEELFLIIRSTAENLGLGGEAFAVSYSGGLFHAGKYVLPLLEKRVSEIGGYLKEPSLPPVWGAVLLAEQEERNGAAGKTVR